MTAVIAKSVVDQAKAILARSPIQAKAAQVWWSSVCDSLEKHHKAKRPLPRSFEVHHINETARKAFLQAIVDGKDFPECKAAALAAVHVSA